MESALPCGATPRTTCRCCGSAELTELFSLGDQFVSNFPGAPSGTDDGGRCPASYGDERVPITLDVCRACTLAQARYAPPAELLYRRHYHYRSGVTATMRAALADVALAARQCVDLQPGDVVLDIGSNDGTLLRCFPENLVRVGVEPADNMRSYYKGTGEPILVPEFWSWDAWAKGGFWSSVTPPKAKVVCALGMLYDLEDANAFVADVARVLHPQGVFVAQLMCLRQMLRQNDVGNLAHEHLEFYTLRSLVMLLAKHGLEVYDVEENDVNGGSYRIFARHADKGFPPPSWGGDVSKALFAERREGLGDAGIIQETVDLWFLRQQELRERLMQFVRHEVVNLKRRLWVYGASTKGNVLLQWWGLGPELAVAAAERDPLKVGRFTVNGVPIRSEADFRAEAPEFALVLPYSFLPEMLAREKAWLEAGGTFIVPLPTPRAVTVRNGHVLENQL